MAKYGFTAAQRNAIWVVHGEKCYLCTCPIDLSSMEVDHILPETLLEDPIRFEEVLRLLGRPPGFLLNSFANWMPACRPCNLKKSDVVFEPTPIIQVVLQRAKSR